MDEKVMDCRGVAIEPGMTVVYPGRRGSSLWLSAGIVQPPKFGAIQKSINVRRVDTGRMVEIFNTQRVAVVASGL
jgi:hypothetical protein